MSALCSSHVQSRPKPYGQATGVGLTERNPLLDPRHVPREPRQQGLQPSTEAASSNTLGPELEGASPARRAHHGPSTHVHTPGSHEPRGQHGGARPCRRRTILCLCQCQLPPPCSHGWKDLREPGKARRDLHPENKLPNCCPLPGSTGEPDQMGWG